MAKYTIKTGQFCALATGFKWQQWLKTISPDLYLELDNHLKVSNSCYSNNKKMREIQDKLVKSNKDKELIEFLLKEYPLLVQKIEEPQQDIKPTRKKTIILKKAQDNPIFKYYNPYILTFPQRLILENENLDILEMDTKKFISTKINTDYIIIKSRAYIEYFDYKYQKEAKNITKESREIYNFKHQK